MKNDKFIADIISEVEHRVVKCILDDIEYGYTIDTIKNKLIHDSYIGNSPETFNTVQNCTEGYPFEILKNHLELLREKIFNLNDKYTKKEISHALYTMLAAGWVSCENSLPESEGEYLTYNKANDSQTVQYFDGRVWGYLATVKPNVTHWTKLPPAPACS